MRMLSIETSCDETAISIVDIHETQKNMEVLSDLVISQISTHAEYGGVFPALAKREHAKNLPLLLIQALKEAEMYHEESYDFDEEICASYLDKEKDLKEKLLPLLKTIQKPDIDMIAVTKGPGLAPALWVGVNFAKVLSSAWHIPIIPVNHMEGHITSILLKENYINEAQALENTEAFSFPMIALLISGGHTQLVLVKTWGDYEIIGETIDDAVGEAFDKVARMLGMDYPGGPKISQAAKQGKENDHIELPRPMLHNKDYRFSFSGLKTAARYLIESFDILDHDTINDIAYAFEHAVTDVLVEKTKAAMLEYGAKGLIIAGGVSANTFIQESFKSMIAEEFGNLHVYLPQRKLCGDNSLMIASAAYIQYILHNKKSFQNTEDLQVDANMKL